MIAHKTDEQVSMLSNGFTNEIHCQRVCDFLLRNSRKKETT